MTQPMNRDAPTEPTRILGTAPAGLSRRGALGLLSATAAGVLAGCTAAMRAARPGMAMGVGGRPSRV